MDAGCTAVDQTDCDIHDHPPRTDRLLVERGLFESRAKAQAAIAAGLVTADGVIVAQAVGGDRGRRGAATRARRIPTSRAAA